MQVASIQIVKHGPAVSCHLLKRSLNMQVLKPGIAHAAVCIVSCQVAQQLLSLQVQTSARVHAWMQACLIRPGVCTSGVHLCARTIIGTEPSGIRGLQDYDHQVMMQRAPEARAQHKTHHPSPWLCSLAQLMEPF